METWSYSYIVLGRELWTGAATFGRKTSRSNRCTIAARIYPSMAAFLTFEQQDRHWCSEPNPQPMPVVSRLDTVSAWRARSSIGCRKTVTPQSVTSRRSERHGHFDSSPNDVIQIPSRKTQKVWAARPVRAWPKSLWFLVGWHVHCSYASTGTCGRATIISSKQKIIRCREDEVGSHQVG